MIRATLLSQVVFDAPGLECTPLDHLQAGEIVEAVREQLGRLPVHQRDAIMARTGYSDLSYRAIAESYGVSRQTVCNWADAAERELRSKMEAYR